MRYFKFLFSLMIFISCNCNKSVEEELTLPNTYWIIDYKDSLDINSSLYLYKFQNNGEAFYMYYDNDTKKIKQYNSYDQVFTNKWSFNKKDSTLKTPLGFSLKIRKVSKDTIFYENKNRKGRLIKFKIEPEIP